MATDLETGKEVVLAGGNLARAIRASLAVPAAFDPVDIDGRLLVDGGLANNVPVSVARTMGADVLIVVDVGSGLFKRDEINTALDVTAQLTNFLFTLNTEAQLTTPGPRTCSSARRSATSAAATSIGRPRPFPSGRAPRATRLTPCGDTLSAKRNTRATWRAANARSGVPEIEFVRTENHSRVGDAVIAERISAQPGKPLDVDTIERDIGRVYGLENFSRCVTTS